MWEAAGGAVVARGGAAGGAGAGPGPGTHAADAALTLPQGIRALLAPPIGSTLTGTSSFGGPLRDDATKAVVCTARDPPSWEA